MDIDVFYKPKVAREAVLGQPGTQEIRLITGGEKDLHGKNESKKRVRKL